MILKDYLDTNGIKYNWFSKRVNITPVGLWKIFKGSDMKLSTALKIEQETNGKITCNELGKQVVKNEEKSDPE